VRLTATHTDPTAANTACSTDSSLVGYSAHLLTFASTSKVFGATPNLPATPYNIQSVAVSLIGSNQQLWVGATQATLATIPGGPAEKRWVAVVAGQRASVLQYY
jgi:hypothetical protein